MSILLSKKTLLRNLYFLLAILLYLFFRYGFSWETLKLFFYWLGGLVVVMIVFGPVLWIMFRLTSGVWAIEAWKNKKISKQK